MHPQIYSEFECLLADEDITGHVLEVGAQPDETALLCSPVFEDAASKTGLNLVGGSYQDFEVIEGNANDMEMFDDDEFDCIVCNATLEHDPYFWRTLAEIRRVSSPGSHVCIGVPGFSRTHERTNGWLKTRYRNWFVRLRLDKLAARIETRVASDTSRLDVDATERTTDGVTDDGRTRHELRSRLHRTLRNVYFYIEPGESVYAATFRVHNHPGDYYRFSPQAIEDVFLNGFTDTTVREVMFPPRLIGKGTVPLHD